MYNLQIIEERIMSIAKKQGLSKNQLLKNVQLNKSVFDNMKKGQIPSVEKIHKIADFLNCSIDFLLGRTDNPKSHLNNTSVFLSNDVETVYKVARTANGEKESIGEYVPISKEKLDLLETAPESDIE